MDVSYNTASTLATTVKNQHKELSVIARQLIDYITQLQSANTEATQVARNAAADKENECKRKFDEIAVILGETPTAEEVSSVIAEARSIITSSAPSAPDAQTMERTGGYKYRKMNTKRGKKLYTRNKTSKKSPTKNKHKRR